MSAIAVAPTEPVSSLPVIVDFSEARNPRSAIASRLFDEATAIRVKLTNPDDAAKKNKSGPLRLMASARGDTFYLNPYLVEIMPDWNCRDLADPANLAHIDFLARSIKANGVLETLSVAPFVKTDGTKSVGVTNGHMRLLATFRAIEVYGAEIKAIPLKQESQETEKAEQILGQITRNSGKELTVMEMANVFKKLRMYNWTVDQIAERSCVTAVRVSQILAFNANASRDIKNLVSSGVVASTLAADVLRDSGNNAAQTERTLTAAVEIARKSGKTHVTKKHVMAVTGTVSLKDEVRDILTATTTTIKVDGKMANIRLTAAHVMRLRELLKIA